MAELAPEALRAPDQPAVQEDAGAETRAEGQHDEGAHAVSGAEGPLREGERVDVVVDEGGKPEALGEPGAEGPPGELRHVERFAADPAARRVDDRGHAETDPEELQLLFAGAPPDRLDQLDEGLDGGPGSAVVGRRARFGQHGAVGGDETGHARRASDIDADDGSHPGGPAREKARSRSRPADGSTPSRAASSGKKYENHSRVRAGSQRFRRSRSITCW